MTKRKIRPSSSDENCQCGSDVELLCGNPKCERPLCWNCALLLEDVYYCPTCFPLEIASVLVTCVERIVLAESVLSADQFRAVVEEANRQLGERLQMTSPSLTPVETVSRLSIQGLVDALSGASLSKTVRVEGGEDLDRE